MAYLVEIKKLSVGNDHAYYEVQPDYEGKFVIKLDLQSQSIVFMQGDHSFTFELTNPEQVIDIPWLSQRAIFAVFVKGREAIQLRSFPDDISFCA